MPAYSQGDPRQKIEICYECREPTGNCEEDNVFNEQGEPLCYACYDRMEGK